VSETSTLQGTGEVSDCLILMISGLIACKWFFHNRDCAL